MKNIFKHPLFLSLLIICIFVALNSQGWLKPVRNTVYYLISPIEEVSYNLSYKANKFVNFVISIKNLNQENTDLKRKNQELLGDVSQLREIARENEFLYKQIGLSGCESRKLILANIIGQDSSSLRKYFLINKGSKEGIKENLVVITAGNLLVGRITEVNDSFSKVQSILDSDSKVNALIQEQIITGLIRGKAGSDLIMDLLPQGISIEKDWTVVTSGLAGVFPSGLMIGQIGEVISYDAEIAQIVEIIPAVDFNNLEKVFVIEE